jgi:GntR family transcriptional regulator
MLCIFYRYCMRGKALHIAISKENPDPMHKQVTDQMRDAIAKGTLPPGARLPSIREMARELTVSPITIKRAYGDLEREGYLITRAGLGSFVAGIDRDRLRAAKVGEIREEIARIAKSAGAYGIPIAEIRRIVDEVKVKRK